MLKIRLMRIGGKKRPFYRVVAVDEQAKRTGGYIELLGTYNPLTEPKEIKLKQDRIDYWIKQGAQPSTGYLRIIGKAPQRKPRKPKKEKKETSPPPAAETQATEAQPSSTAKTIISEESSKEKAKSETDKAIGAVESTPKEEISKDSTSQQTHSEAKSSESGTSDTDGPSGALQSDEPATPEKS